MKTEKINEVLERVNEPGDSPIFTFTGEEKSVVSKLDKDYDYVDVDGHGKVKITEKGEEFLEQGTNEEENDTNHVETRITEADRVSKRSSAKNSLERIENASGNFLYSAMKDLASTTWMYAESTEDIERSYRLYQLIENMVILLEEIRSNEN